MESRRGVATRAALFILISFVLAGIVSMGVYSAYFAADSAPVGDADRVFCLADEQRTKLTEAAANLKLKISSDGLREGQGPDFDRACAALTDAARIPQQDPNASANSDSSVSDVLLSVVLGSVLTGLPVLWVDWRSQNRLLADALDHAANKYISAAHAQRRRLLENKQQGKIPVDRAVLDGQNEVVAQLRKIAARRTGWTVPGRLHRELSSQRLGEAMNEHKPDQSREERDQELKEKLATLQDSIKDVVNALERPWRWHSDMRFKQE